jgi:hypothetical protein
MVWNSLSFSKIDLSDVVDLEIEQETLPDMAACTAGSLPGRGSTAATSSHKVVTAALKHVSTLDPSAPSNLFHNAV